MFLEFDSQRLGHNVAGFGRHSVIVAVVSAGNSDERVESMFERWSKWRLRVRQAQFPKTPRMLGPQ